MLNKFKIILTPLIFIFFSFMTKAESHFNDGPYVFEQKNQRQAVWICEGKKITQQISLQTPQKIEQCGLSATLWPATKKEDKTLEYSGDFKVAAASDIHGQLDLFKTLLKNNGIINQQQQWSFGKNHFVISGDVFDRGPQVTEALWFLYDLEKQAQQAGGKLHFLLGNHEVMVLNGDLRYLHEKYVNTANKIEQPFENLFRPKSILGDWLRSRPVVVKVNGMLFVHGGFHPKLAKEKKSLAFINHEFKSHLVESELSQPREGFARYLHKKNGLIWYRGYFNKITATPTEIDLLLKHFQVTNIIVGHTTQDTVETRYDGKVIVIDAAMKDGLNGELLLWEKGVFTRGLLSGKKLLLSAN